MKTRPCITEQLLMGRKESNQIYKSVSKWNSFLPHKNCLFIKYYPIPDVNNSVADPGGGSGGSLEPHSLSPTFKYPMKMK